MDGPQITDLADHKRRRNARHAQDSQADHASAQRAWAEKLLDRSLAELSLSQLNALTEVLLDRQAEVLEELNTPGGKYLFAPAVVVDEEQPSGAERSDADRPGTDRPGAAEPIMTAVDYARATETVYRKASTLTDRMTHHLVNLYDHENPVIRTRHLGISPGKTPFKSGTDFAGQTLAVSKRNIADRNRRGGLLNPDHWLKAPGIAELARTGSVDPEIVGKSAASLGKIRSAARRSGASIDEADQLVAAQETEFLDHATVRDPKTFVQFANRAQKTFEEGLTSAPDRELTPEQIAHETGLVYVGPVGSTLHRWSYTTDEIGHARLMRIRERANQSLRTDLTDASRAEPTAPAEPTTPTEPVDTFDGRSPSHKAGDLLGEMIAAGLVLDQDHAAGESAVENAPDTENPIASDKKRSGRLTVVEPDSFGPGSLTGTGTELNVIVSLADLRGDPPGGPPTVSGGRTPKPPDHYASTSTGLFHSIGQLRQLACQAKIIPHVLGAKSEPLDVGRAQYTVPKSLQRAVFVRDRGCAAPGCTRSTSWSQIHHIVHWAHGGETKIDNLVLLCAHHHAAVHAGVLEVKMIDRIPHFRADPITDPTGTWHRNYHRRQ